VFVGVEQAPHTILIVDDEKLFTQSLSEGLQALDPSLHVLTAENGLVASGYLERERVDLVLTDLKMPVMDGFELLASMSRRFASVPVLVMTAFGTPEVDGRLRELGVDGFVEKPVDFQSLAARIEGELSAGARGYVRGIGLPTFLQVLALEKKSCSLHVTAGDRSGQLHFVGGVLWDAEAGDLAGEEAAQEIVRWEGAAIEILGGHGAHTRRVARSVEHLLLESFRVEDERRARASRARNDEQETGDSLPSTDTERSKEDNDMTATEKLKELAALEGFAGAGVFTPTGEPLAVVSAGTGFSKEIGILANNVLMNAQKASLEMGSGRGQQVHVEAEKAHFLVRCLNEGNDPLKSQPGKAHIHLVLALSGDSQIGFAKMKVNSTIDKLGEDFRL
jgi:DNA-binding response OmpR family regulator